MKTHQLLSSTVYDHAAVTASLVAAAALLRVEFIASPLLDILTWLSPSSSDFVPTTYEPLSLINWILHLFMMALGLELATSFLRTRCPTERTIAMGVMHVLFGLQGAATILEHSLLGGVNPLLAQKLHLIGFRAFMHFNVYLVPFVLASPKRGWYVAPTMAFLTITEQVTFANWYGRILGMASTLATLCTPEFHALFKLGYVGLAFIPVLSPKKLFGLDEESDEAHALIAVFMNVFMATMVLGLRLKENELSVKLSRAE